MEKILITGTGRCGTTFLIKLFSFLEFNTGYNRSNYINFIFPNCNSGMERMYNENYYILKNPNFIRNIKYILEDQSVIIKKVIIPIRDLRSSAKSRVKHNKLPGGLLDASDEESQIKYYNKLLANYIYLMTKHDIDTILIDFDRMISDKAYLFNKIKSILDEKNISFETFCNVYDEVSSTSKPYFLHFRYVFFVSMFHIHFHLILHENVLRIHLD